MNLIDRLIKERYLKTDRIIKAFRRINRSDFVPDSLIALSEDNIPLPIGHNQTISQPLTVAFMLELLQPRVGDKILDIGSGSGWTTALLADITEERGKVIALERIKELCLMGERNVNKFNFIKEERVKFFCMDGSGGYKKEAPFDKILVSAAAEELPEEIKNQITIGGRLVIPIKGSVWLIERTEKNKFKEFEYPGFVFVPLIKNEE